MRRFALIAVVLAGSLAGCGKNSPPPPRPVVSTPGAPALPTAAQSHLATIRLWLGPEELMTEIAATPVQEQTGMMFRTNLPENAGMIFLLGQPRQAAFWMKNCPLPLSCAYIDPEGTIVELHDLKPYDETPVTADSANVQYVLEVNQGWFSRHHITAGTLVRTEYGSLPATFIRRR
ncbi:MAG TPA: DUF192 domain-containing protein [Candidatus Saccharimonadales bacterium]|nr:DUF192 domain-containing protein [Candidatus Saccharimonadales bacterium]